MLLFMILLSAPVDGAERRSIKALVKEIFYLFTISMNHKSGCERRFQWKRQEMFLYEQTLKATGH